MNFIKVEGTVRKMSLNHHQFLDNEVRLKTRRRSHWQRHATAAEQTVTQLAAHSLLTATIERAA